jgi:ribonuclease Z
LAYRISEGDQSIVIGGDGVPCVALDELVLGASAYVQTVIREDLVRSIPNVRLQDIVDYHSTVQQAADTAQRGGVAALVLTHMVPSPFPGTEDEWRSLASAFTGLVVLGDDLTSLDLDTMVVTG